MIPIKGHHVLSTGEIADGQSRKFICRHCREPIEAIYTHVREAHADVVAECPLCLEMFTYEDRHHIECPSCVCNFALDTNYAFTGIRRNCPYCSGVLLAKEQGEMPCPHCTQPILIGDKLMPEMAVTDDATTTETEAPGFATPESTDVAVLRRRIAELETERDELRRRLEQRELTHPDVVGVPTTTAHIHHLDFEVLPPGNWDVEDVIQHFKKLQENPLPEWRGMVIDWRRIRQIQRLQPTDCYIGKKMWRGYQVYTFRFTPKVVLECPIKGNAIYVLGDNWREMLRFTKQEVRDRGNPIKVVHKGDWLDRLATALRD
jgi:uncharacterized Zn finger protein (UPF0148 family)